MTYDTVMYMRFLYHNLFYHNNIVTFLCLQHPDVKSIASKIEVVTGVPADNSESFQVRKLTKDEMMNSDE